MIGGGRIGRATIDRLRPFVREVLLYDPYLESAPDGVERVADLDTLLRRTDVLTLHLPLVRGVARDDRRPRAGPAATGCDGRWNVSRGGLVGTRPRW